MRREIYYYENLVSGTGRTTDVATKPPVRMDPSALYCKNGPLVTAYKNSNHPDPIIMQGVQEAEPI